MMKIPEDLRERYGRLLLQSKGSKAQRRYAEFQKELIERIASQAEMIAAERRISDGCRADASRMGDQVARLESRITSMIAAADRNEWADSECARAVRAAAKGE